LYQCIASAHAALSNLERADEANPKWQAIWEEYLEFCVNELPRGSGFDTTPEIKTDSPFVGTITIVGEFHKMDEHGSYDGWLTFTITVSASLLHGFDFNCLVEDEEDSSWPDYFSEAYSEALGRPIDHAAWMKTLVQKHLTVE
jgi:hypothetical protein